MSGGAGFRRELIEWLRAGSRGAWLGVGVLIASVAEGGIREAVAQQLVRVVGTAVDDATEEPIEGAAVRLTDERQLVRETITGPVGGFVFEELSPGRYMVGVRHIGYEVLIEEIEVGAAGNSLEIRLRTQAIVVEPLEVSVEGRAPRLAEAGFYDRMEEGWGVFLEPEWIEANKTGFTRLSDFMTTLQMRAPMSRCSEVPVYLDRKPIGGASGSGTSRARSINPAGTHRSRGEGAATLLDELSVFEVGAAELYQAGSKVPWFAWNAGTMTCGAIILWSNWTAATVEIPRIDVTLCDTAGRAGEVAVDGFVEDAVTEVRLPAAHVIASYPASGDRERVETVVRTDSLGRFRLCDLPEGAEVQLAAAYGPHAGDSLAVTAAAEAEVRLAVPVTPLALVTGLVVNGVTGQPLETVRIVVDDTDFRAATNRSGAFTLEGLPPGTYRIRALCGGFDPSAQTIEVAEGARVRVELRLRSRGFTQRTLCSA